MHPLVAATIASEISHARRDAARHARAARQRRGRGVVRRVLTGR
jgi:hypothetical protein